MPQWQTDPLYRFYPKEFPQNAPIKPYQYKIFKPPGKGRIASAIGVGSWVWKNRKWIFQKSAIIGTGTGVAGIASDNPDSQTLRPAEFSNSRKWGQRYHKRRYKRKCYCRKRRRRSLRRVYH